MKNQFEVFTSVLSNFADAQKAVTLATESANSAEKENEAYLDSLGAKLNLLKQQFQELVLGEGGLQSFAKGLLDVGIAILKFANSDVGQLTIAVGLAVTAVTLLRKAFIALAASNFSASIGMIVTEIGSLIAGTGTLTGVMTALTISMKTCPLFWGTLAVGGITTIAVAIDALNVTLDEQIEKFNEAKSVYDSAKSELEGLVSQLKSVRDRIDEINSQENLSITDETQLRLLQEEEASLENQVLLQQELARAAKEEATTEAERTLTKTFKSGEVFGYSTPTHEDPLLKEQSGTVLDAVSIYDQKKNEEQDAID